MVLQATLKVLRDSDPDKVDGHLNYLFSSILDRTYTKNYKSLNAAIGVLECCKLELYRRVVVPYEDQKNWDNGDVYLS